MGEGSPLWGGPGEGLIVPGYRRDHAKVDPPGDFPEYRGRARPGLDRRSRSVATLAALGAENEIAMHVRAALSPDEIKEVILHTAVYAGVPRANSAFAIAQKVIAEAGE